MPEQPAGEYLSPEDEAWRDDFGDPDGAQLPPAINALIARLTAENALLREAVDRFTDDDHWDDLSGFEQQWFGLWRDRLAAAKSGRGVQQ